MIYDEYLKKPSEKRLNFYLRNGRLYHVMRSQQFHIKFLDELFKIANQIKFLIRKPNGQDFLKSLLRHKKAMLYFTQPSTRTFLSFLAACQLVGMDTAEVRDPSLSSEYKGESQEDAVRVFSSYFDLIIMRDPKPRFCEYMAYLLDQTTRSVPFINGGSGKDQHPTQALLDIYTMHRSFQNQGGVKNKTYAFVGDLLRGRAVRSVVFLLSQYKNVKMIFIAPPKLQIGKDLEDSLKESNVTFEKSENLNDVLPIIDSLYMTRIQDEYDNSEESNSFIKNNYKLNTENIKLMKKNSIIMHPLPRRDEIHPSVDLDSRAMYWRQLRNGLYIRSALILYIFKVNHRLMEY